MAKYIQIQECDVPANIRFDVFAQDQGQMVEVAWGTTSKWEAGEGAKYKRILDKTETAPDKRVTFWCRK